MDATVIIPTRDRAELLELTLARLVRQSHDVHRWELIVVDDGSAADDSARVVESVALPHVRCLRQERRGASAARNAAIAVARGRVLVFLDDDAFVGPHFLVRHLALHRDDTPALVAGGIVQVRAIPDEIDEAPGLRGYHRHPMPGGNASAPAAAVRAVGGYDPWFFTYGWQDQELAQRLIAHGLRRRFAWGAPIHHYKPPGYDVDLRSQFARERERGRMGARFYHKHPRIAVGVTTKAWPPVRALISLLSGAAGIERIQSRIERGEVDGRTVRGWQAALLRSRTESRAAAEELTRLTGTGVGLGAGLGAQLSAEPSPESPAPTRTAATQTASGEHLHR